MKKDNSEVTNFTNFVEIHVYGLMRSGNHAIIEWIQNQYGKNPTCFLNNVKHGPHDPYKNSTIHMTGINRNTTIESLRETPKELLIASYEDRQELADNNTYSFIKSIFQNDTGLSLERFLMPSKHILNLLIIRDPFNCIASRIKLLENRGAMGGVSDINIVVRNWKELARKAIELIKTPKKGEIVVSYNQWVTDPHFRRELSEKIYGKFDDSSLVNIPQFGGGSSFNITPHEKLTISSLIKNWKKALEIDRYSNLGHYWKRFTFKKDSANMNFDVNTIKVFERWKSLRQNQIFCDSICDDEILELSEELFGEIPGTREFVKSKKRIYRSGNHTANPPVS